MFDFNGVKCWYLNICTSFMKESAEKCYFWEGSWESPQKQYSLCNLLEKFPPFRIAFQVIAVLK